MWWLDRWGLTPDQVDQLPARDVIRLPVLAAEKDRLEAAERKAARG